MGALVCSELIISERADRTWNASYLERLPGGDLLMTGRLVRIAPDVLAFLIDDGETGVLRAGSDQTEGITRDPLPEDGWVNERRDPSLR